MNRLPRFLVWLAGALAAVSILTGIFIVNGVGKAQVPLTYPSSWPQISSSPQTKPIHMMLLQVNDAKQRYVAGLLLVKSGNRVAIADVDAHMTIDLRIRGQFDLRRASHEVTSPELIQALNIASGLSIDGAIVFRDVGIAALVDGIGGVSLTTSQRIRLTPRGQTPVEYLPAGTHKVKGEVAANFALNSASLNSVTSQQRLRMVISQVLDNIPSDSGEIEQLISALGQSGRSTIATAEVAQFFLQTRGQWRDAMSLRIPSVPAEYVLHPEWKIFDVEMLRAIVKPLDRSLLWDADVARMNDEFRVYVQGSSDDRMKVQELLSQGSTYFVDGGFSSTSKQTILYATGGIPKATLDELKDSLKLPQLKVQSVVSLPSGADMQLDVGEDFHNLHVKNGQ